MIYLDVTSAAKSAVNMGVHRTVRGIYRYLATSYDQELTPLRWDFQRKNYSTLSNREFDNLTQPFASYESPQAVPLNWGWKSWKDDWTRGSRLLPLETCLTEHDTLLIPDLSWDERIHAWEKWKSLLGKKIAIFHDAMPLNIPGQSGSNDALFKDYVIALGHLDQVICISKEVQADLLRYWEKFHIPAKPTPVLVWPVPFDTARPDNLPNQASRHVLYVARLKLRKNHLVLLDACELLWKKGLDFTLDLIGVSDAFLDTRRILARIEELRKKGYPVQWRKHISDVELNQAYHDSAFTAFPSQMEGFGLPIIESLWHQRPVICGRNGAIGEVAEEGGGCFLIDQNNTQELTQAIEQLLEDSALYNKLYQQSAMRNFKSWDDYGKELALILQNPSLRPTQIFTP